MLDFKEPRENVALVSPGQAVHGAHSPVPTQRHVGLPSQETESSDHLAAGRSLKEI